MKKIAIVALLSAFAAAPAVAADMYGAIDLGSVSYSNANGGPTGTTAFKNPGTIRITGGSQINQNLGVEIGYSIIGESVIDTFVVGLGSAKETLKTSSFQAAVVGTAPSMICFPYLASWV
jgi:opacity protein-like surface antigen